jgi:hypothetical protein
MSTVMKKDIVEGTNGQMAMLDVHNYSVKAGWDIIGDGLMFAFYLRVFADASIGSCIWSQIRRIGKHQR